MALNPRLELRAETRLALTPVVRISLSVLRMSPADLAEELAREAARNPFLSFDPGALPRATAAPDESTQVAAKISFQADLVRQITRQDLPPDIVSAALLLVSELRSDGLLDIALDDLAREYAVELADLERGLAVLQSCEPTGIGARSVGECLALQLVEHGLTRAEADATVAELPALARQDWRQAGAALGLNTTEVRARAALLRALSPRPITAEDTGETPTLTADLRLVRGADGSLALEQDRSSANAVMLDAAMVRSAAESGFGEDLLLRARALIAALTQRGATLQRIGDWLIETQPAFFDHGPAALRPATQLDLAKALGLHPSTISRALAGKAIDVDGRLWPLGGFFSSALASDDGPVSARAVQGRIAALVAAEPPGRPLSDDAITGLLRAEGVDIARRTVAKYRQGLRIPSSSARRRLAAARRGE